jgi:ribose transport system ATP-binding protein
MRNIILEMTGISKTFGGIKALESVDLYLKSGEVLGLIGENGAGKSTLMRILSGMENPDRGKTFIDGQEEQIPDPSHAYMLGIGMIPQDLILVPDMTVIENIFLGREIINRFGALNVNDMAVKCEALLANLGCRHIYLDAKVGRLPKPDQQVIAVARRILQGGKIFIMDEPTSALSEKETAALFELIRKMCNSGASVIFISHRLEEVLEICNRIMVLRNGHLVKITETGEAVDKRRLIYYMVGSKLKDEFPHFAVASGKEVLRVENLAFTTNQGNIVKNINFSVHEGEVLGITGLVGVGKTELGQTLIGLKKSNYGKIFIDKQETIIQSPVKAFEKGFGYVSEDRREEGLVLGLQCLFNMTLSSMDKVSKAFLISSQKEKQFGRKYIERLSMKEEFLMMEAQQLSGGNQQKVVIIRQILNDARIIIFDEPTKGIDVAAKSEISKLISELSREKKAICLLSSEPREVLGISDRILVLTAHGLQGPFARGTLDYSQLMAIELEESEDLNGNKTFN